MKHLNHYLLLGLFVLINTLAFAQQETFDVVSYTLPKGWQKQQVEGGVQFVAVDKKTGGYAIAIITKSMPSSGSADNDFKNQWKSLLVNTLSSITEPVMIAPEQNNGWDIYSGNGNYVDRTIKGLATLITATSQEQTAAVVLMTNTQQFQNDLLAFINSLELAKSSQNDTTRLAPAATGNPGKISVEGIWCDYLLETTGYYINGAPQYTAGYLRKEYTFYPDGTYLFRNKQWLTKTKDISFIYESGTYSLVGNQITISPKQGKAEWWSKAASGKTTEWGKFIKASEYKLEKTTYSFTIEYDPNGGQPKSKIILKPGKPTQRDGGQYNAPNEPYEFRYSLRDLGSLIDNPPGFKTGVEDKPLASAVTQQTTTVSTSNTNNALTGKIWEGSSSEKFIGAGPMTGHYTGGFFKYQYKFNSDGTYRFVYVGASAYTETNQLQYETGTYLVTNNQLTITPTNGANDEWSVVGGPIKLSGMSDVQISSIKEHWGQRLTSEKRKLEKVTYTFKVEYQEGNHATALIVQHTNGHTEREGNGETTYYFETSVAKSALLPKEIK